MAGPRRAGPFHRSLERGDLARAESAAGHLARIGRDSSAYHLELALYEMRNGRRGDALAVKSKDVRHSGSLWNNGVSTRPTFQREIPNDASS